MSEHERQAGTWPTDAATGDTYVAADVRLDHGLIAAATAPVLNTAAPGEHLGTDPADPPVPRISEVEVTRVVDVLHAQADRLMEDAARMAQRAAATRATAAQQDRQADDLEWRADRLHAQAEDLRADTKR